MPRGITQPAIWSSPQQIFLNAPQVPALDTLPLSSGNVDAQGVYLLENGVEAWLYFGGAAPPQLVHDLLGAAPKP